MQLEDYVAFVTGKLEESLQDRDTYAITVFSQAAVSLLEHASNELEDVASDELYARLLDLLGPQ